MTDHETSVDWRRWMRDFGRQQRRVREFLGLSQQDLARRAGVTEEMVSRLEMARAISTPLLIAVKIGLTLASALRQLDPATVPPDLRATLETPTLLPSAFRTEPRAERPSDADRGDVLRGRQAAAPRSARRAR